MKRLLTSLSIAAMLAPLGACQIKTGLPFASATAGPNIASSATDESDASGGYDEAPNSCEQEFGQDAGGRIRSAHTIGSKSVIGCFVQGDKRDTYLIKVPDDQETYTYKIKVIAQHKSLRAWLGTTDGERLASDFMLGGGAWRKNIQLEGGETYVLQIQNGGHDEFNTYKLRAKPNTRIAEN